jgi:hypothetical protein
VSHIFDPTASRTVDWLSVREFILPYLDAVGSWPMAGTIAWQELPDEDPAKLASLLDAAQHWTLRIDCSQEAHAEASKAISVASDWISLAGRLILRLPSSHIPRKKAS